MKTVYIPKGETAHYQSLYADHLIVDGCLNVDRSLDARNISGKGVIHAGKVSANVIHIGYLDAAMVMCHQLLCDRVDAPEIFAAQRVVVSGVLSACYVRTPKLTTAVCEVEKLAVKKQVTVPAGRWGVFGILFIAALQRLQRSVMTLLAPGEAVDADYEVTEPNKRQDAAFRQKEPEPVDEELNRVVNLFKLCRDCGYTLRLIPGKPEDTAPVFDFDAEKIQNRAA